MVAAKRIGVRELKLNPGKVVMAVHDTNEEIDVTYRGEVVAKIVPVQRRPSLEEVRAAWQRHREIAHEISKDWPEGVSAADVIKDVRREL